MGENVMTRDPLDRALAGLVAEGVLTVDQAQQVLAARDREAGPPETVARASRLPEALGYLGGALVVTAGLLVVARGWSAFSYATQVALLGLSTSAVVVAAIVIARGTPGGVAALREAPPGQQAQRRRLVGVLLVLGAGLAAGTVGLVLDHAEASLVLLPAAVAALAVTAVAVLVAPGVVPTLGLFAASGVFLGSLNELVERPAPTLVWLMVLTGAAVTWLALAPRLTRERTVSQVLGLATLVITGWTGTGIPSSELVEEWGHEAVRPFGFAVLLAVVAVGVLQFLRDEGWPWITAAAVAAAAAVFELAGEALGGVVAAFVAGLVFLAVSALLIVRRGRAGAGAPPP